MRPRIALTLGRPTRERADSERRYVDALEGAGAEVIVVRPSDPIPSAIAGLLLAGGGDVAAARYGDEETDCRSVEEARDELELTLAARFMELDLPILGICRGFQVLNVAHAGRLIQDVAGHAADGRLIQHHDVRPLEGSRLALATGGRPLAVNSRHHQAVDLGTLGHRLVATAMVGELVEAFEATDRRWVVGVQWHPERAGEVSPGAGRLIDALVAESARTGSERADPDAAAVAS